LRKPGAAKTIGSFASREYPAQYGRTKLVVLGLAEAGFHRHPDLQQTLAFAVIILIIVRREQRTQLINVSTAE
jgi:hypothetical protein